MTTSANKGALNVAVWIVQVLLAVGFGMAGVMKSTAPIADLSAKMPWVSAVPEALVRFIGVSELVGAVGLILPAATRIRPGLTALAAAGLVVVDGPRSRVSRHARGARAGCTRKRRARWAGCLRGVGPIQEAADRAAHVNRLPPGLIA